MKATSRVLTGLVALPTLFVASQAAGFTGDFAVTPPDAGTYFTSQALGTWTGEISQGGSITAVASINTSGAPNSITLTAQPQVFPSVIVDGFTPVRNATLQADVGLAYAQLTIAAPTAGTFSFSYSLDLSSAAASYLENGTWTPFAPGSSTLSLVLDAGEVFGFRVENSTGFTGIFNNFNQPNSRGAALADVVFDVTPVVSESLTIRDPSFEPVPEASTVAGGLLVAGMMGWAFLRARRQA